MPENITYDLSLENTHIRDINELPFPLEIKEATPATPNSIATVLAGRTAVENTLATSSTREKLLVVTGPCSVNDPKSALEYAEWIKQKRDQYGDELEIMMRMYFEKPRTTVGWKGLINDPNLDESFDINTGLRTARQLAVDITDKGVPVGTEILDNMTPQYFGGLISWGAIGARTVESQPHRELASGLSFPIGFKNGTGGNVQFAVDAVSAAAHPHRFLAITDEGTAAIASTSGNPHGHIILRGGSTGPNYSTTDIASATEKLAKKDLSPIVMIDSSHANSGKDHTKQIEVVQEVARQITGGSTAIMGVMIESNLKAGAQPFSPGSKHEYGLSITDACVDLDTTNAMLEILANSIQKRKTLNN